MRHDAKLGLALGMLVIGFAVAFCFPRQPQPSAWLQLEAPEPTADSELDFLPMRAYTSPPADAASPGSSESIQPQPSTATQVIAGPPPEPIAPLDNSSPGPVLAAEKGLSRAVGSAKPAISTEPALSESLAESQKESQKTYQVRPGDTLSGIANRFLGSGARFLEVYEANRDRLSTPDALQVGQELRIPSKNADSAKLARKAPAVEHSDSDSETPSAEFDRPGKPPWMAEKPSENRR